MTLKERKVKLIWVLLISFSLLMGLSSNFVYASSLNGVGEGNTTIVENVTTTQNQNVVVPNNNQSVVTQDTTQNVTQNTTQNVTQNTTTSETFTENVGLGNMPASTQTVEDVEDTASAVAGMFANAGPKAEDIATANKIIEPVANFMNMAMAVILGITSLLMMFTTVLDLLYIAFPRIRDSLDGGRQGMQNMMGAGGRGMGRGMGRSMGYGGRMGYGGMGGGMYGGAGAGMGYGGAGMGGAGMGYGGGAGNMMQQQQQLGGGLSAIGRWVSDEAVSACNMAQGGAMEGQMGMNGMPVKSIVFTYIKKRSMFLILFGVCVVLFTSTVFTDLGIRLGTWALRLIMGFAS